MWEQKAKTENIILNEKSDLPSTSAITPIPAGIPPESALLEKESVLGFSDHQKAAILASLTFVSTSGGINATTQTDIQVLLENLSFLDANLDDPKIELMQEERYEAILIKTLITLDPAKKEWFAAALHWMASSDGRVISSKLATAVSICNKIGISDDEYVAIIGTAQSLAKRL